MSRGVVFVARHADTPRGHDTSIFVKEWSFVEINLFFSFRPSSRAVLPEGKPGHVSQCKRHSLRDIASRVKILTLRLQNGRVVRRVALRHSVFHGKSVTYCVFMGRCVTNLDATPTGER